MKNLAKLFGIVILFIVLPLGLAAQELRDGVPVEGTIARNLDPVLFKYSSAQDGYLTLTTSPGFEVSSVYDEKKFRERTQAILSGGDRKNYEVQRTDNGYRVDRNVRYTIEVKGSKRGKFNITATLDTQTLVKERQAQQAQQAEQAQRTQQNSSRRNIRTVTDSDINKAPPMTQKEAMEKWQAEAISAAEQMGGSTQATAALSGKYIRPSNNDNISFTGNIFILSTSTTTGTATGNRTNYTNSSGIFSIANNKLTLNSSDGKIINWTIIGENTISDQDGRYWDKEGTQPQRPEVIVQPFQAQTQEIIVQGTTLIEKFDWLRAFARSGNRYVVEINANESINPLDLPKISNITIILRGIGANRTLSLASGGNMFSVNNGVTLILDNNITLHGIPQNQNQDPRGYGNILALVSVNGGELIMNNGSTITGNYTHNRNGYYEDISGGVSVNNGTFIMNGGIISGNTSNCQIPHNLYGASQGGGVFVKSGASFTMNNGTISGNVGGSGVSVSGTFEMNGGTISGNGGEGVTVSGTFTMNNGTISGNRGGVFVKGKFIMKNGTISGNTTLENGGGVKMVSGIFTMSGGTISGNTASGSGGGVYVSFRGTNFTKTGGTITGYTGDQRNGNVVKSSGTVRNYKGHAVYAGDTNFKIRESTAGPEDNLSIVNGTASGAWDN